MSVTGGSRWCRRSMRSLIKVVSEPRSFMSTGLPKTFWSFLAPGPEVCVCRGQVSAVRPPGGGVSVCPSQCRDLHRRFCLLAAWPTDTSASFLPTVTPQNLLQDKRMNTHRYICLCEIPFLTETGINRTISFQLRILTF